MSSSRRRQQRRRSPLSELGRPLPPARKPCTRCNKPDTERGFGVIGDAAFLAGLLAEYVGMDQDEAIGLAKREFNRRNAALGERVDLLIRLCRGCAKLTGARVCSFANLDGLIVSAIQPEEEE